MVKIDTLVFAPEQTKQLLGDKTLNATETSHDGEPDKRFKLVDPQTNNRSDNCMFFTFYFVLKNPCISFCLFLLFLISLGVIVPIICHLKCQYVDKYGINNPLHLQRCISDGPLHFSYTVESFPKLPKPTKAQCDLVQDKDKRDCLPRRSVPLSERGCFEQGCCWRVQNGSAIPVCFFASSFDSYKYINVSTTDVGAVAYLQIVSNSSYPKNVPIVRVDFNYRTQDVLQVKIYDPTTDRYEPPLPELPPLPSTAAKNTKYVVDIDKSKIGFRVVRRSNNKTVFSTQDIGGFTFADQFLQLSAHLPSSQLYGLGQQRNNFSLDMNRRTITLFNHDEPPTDKTNLYGSHPFYLAMEGEGLSDGVLLLNSNAMDIELTPGPAITYRTIGGILNFFIFMGPSPAEVLQQYTELVGRPFMPPYWSLGFHLSRYGYKTLQNTIQVLDRNQAAGIPVDTQWNDLDYMNNGNDFTYDNISFRGLPGFVEVLHKQGMHFIVLVDPGISAGELPGSYPPYDQGIKQQVFVTDSSGNLPFKGKVWNKKSTVFVDFFKPAAVPYWMAQLRSFNDKVAFDGAWIDMNEPSNFVNGKTEGCEYSELNNPPYLPRVAGQMLYYRTICMSAHHHNNETHYNLHNLYGLAEAIVTSFAMQQIRNKRAFVVSRSSFPGIGRYSGVWSGDINSNWDDMAHSVSDVLSFSLFGIPMSGADICGFNGNSTAALCQRWSQLGAFYPFCRNHNSDNSPDQDPVALGPDVVKAARDTLLIRYSLLPYLYTLFWHAHSRGDTVARPMFVEFPNDANTYDIKTQFMWGSALLIAPVLQEDKIQVAVYIPAGRWYSFYSGYLIRGYDSVQLLNAPPDTIPLLLRGGCIVPKQHPEDTTTLSRSNPVDLIIALDDKGQASGDLYWDDGDSLDHNDGVYNLLTFSLANKQLSSKVEQWRYNTNLTLGEIKLLGVNSPVHDVLVNRRFVSFKYFSDLKTLVIQSLNLDLSKSFTMFWK